MFITLNNLNIIIACYLIGSIPFGLLISYALKKQDPRLHGSKNIGATNILRTSGWRLGLLTLFFDIFKGYIPVFFLKSSSISVDYIIVSIFIGHIFPVWLKFKGGKGIAVIIGCLAAYNMHYGLFFVSMWLTLAAITRYSSLSALIASSSTLILMVITDDHLFLPMLGIVVMIFLKHSSNIKRLLSGEESKIILKK